MIEICTISALLVTVTLAGLAGEVTAVEAAVRRAMLFSRCPETRPLPPFGTYQTSLFWPMFASRHQRSSLAVMRGL